MTIRKGRGGFLVLAACFACTLFAACPGAAPQGGGEDNPVAQAPKVVKAAREVIGGPSSGSPYSPAVSVGDALYVSGQIAVDPESGAEIRDSAAAEAEQVLKNIKRLVEMAGFEMKDVVRATVFLTDINDYGPVNEIYVKYFPEDPPARACVAVKELARGFKVEISCIAQK